MDNNIPVHPCKLTPILFSTPMVQAILEGRKTQTRRIIKSKHESGLYAVSTAKYEPDCRGYYHNRSVQSLDWDEGSCGDILCPYGEVGDVLWVRETWCKTLDVDEFEDGYLYKAEGSTAFQDSDGDIIDLVKWKPSIHMPKAACRIWLEITDIRVEGLQDISEEDAIAEGIWLDTTVLPNGYTLYGMPHWNTAKECYSVLWEEINGPKSWELNPYVWCLSFKRIASPLTK